MRAGRLRTKIIIKDFTNTPNADGTPNESWTEFASVWGNLVWLNGKSYFDNFEYAYSIKGSAYVRWRDDLHRDMKLEIDGQDYDIEDIKPADNKRRELVIVFKAVEA